MTALERPTMPGTAREGGTEATGGGQGVPVPVEPQGVRRLPVADGELRAATADPNFMPSRHEAAE